MAENQYKCEFYEEKLFQNIFLGLENYFRCLGNRYTTFQCIIKISRFSPRICMGYYTKI
jgi:hypothetical protein